MKPAAKVNKDWADQYLTEVRRVIRTVLGDLADIEIAPHQLDTQEATDLVINNTNTWGWRLRRPNVRRRDFTIRSLLPSGHETELSKLLNGHGDFYIYSWTDEPHAARQKFSEWAIINLDEFRDRWQELEQDATLGPPNQDDDNRWLYWPMELLLGKYGRALVPKDKMAQQRLFTR